MLESKCEIIIFYLLNNQSKLIFLIIIQNILSEMSEELKMKKMQVISILLILLFTLIITIESATMAFAHEGQNVTQNWAAAAVFYNTSADETETFHMTEEEFLTCKIELETRLVFAYSTYYNSLKGAEREVLEETQKAWIDCYYSYTSALEQLWLEPVKIYFGVTKKERRTNVYREAVILLLTNRITDLEEWNAGRLVGMEDAFFQEKEKELKKAKEQLQVDMGLCLYVIREEYRPKIRESHQKFAAFLESNKKFLSLITDDNKTIIAAEGLLQVQRMSYLTNVHYQGCRFFRREREE